MARGKPHDDTLKAQVMAALLTGQAPSYVAREYGVAEGTVHEWARQVRGVQTKKDVDLGALLNDYLRASLEALTAQAELFRDPEWVKKQSADDIAILHGVLADKVFRILAALEPAESS